MVSSKVEFKFVFIFRLECLISLMLFIVKFRQLEAKLETSMQRINNLLCKSLLAQQSQINYAFLCFFDLTCVKVFSASCKGWPEVSGYVNVQGINWVYKVIASGHCSELQWSGSLGLDRRWEPFCGFWGAGVWQSLAVKGSPEGLDWWKSWARKATRRCSGKLGMIKKQEWPGAVLRSEVKLTLCSKEYEDSLAERQKHTVKSDVHEVRDFTWAFFLSNRPSKFLLCKLYVISFKQKVASVSVTQRWNVSRGFESDSLLLKCYIWVEAGALPAERQTNQGSVPEFVREWYLFWLGELM